MATRQSPVGLWRAGPLGVCLRHALITQAFVGPYNYGLQHQLAASRRGIIIKPLHTYYYLMNCLLNNASGRMNAIRVNT